MGTRLTQEKAGMKVRGKPEKKTNILSQEKSKTSRRGVGEGQWRERTGRVQTVGSRFIRRGRHGET